LLNTKVGAPAEKTAPLVAEGWLDYSNEHLGYAFSYPESWNTESVEYDDGGGYVHVTNRAYDGGLGFGGGGAKIRVSCREGSVLQDYYNGDRKIFVNEESDYTATEPPQGELRRMDCMDCHNRPSHVFDSPSKAVNKAISFEKIDRV